MFKKFVNAVKSPAGGKKKVVKKEGKVVKFEKPVVEEVEEKMVEKVDEKMMEKFEDFDHFEPELLPENPKPWNEWSLKDFDIGKPLGVGTYGHVYLARTMREKFMVALKVLHLKKIEELEKSNKDIDFSAMIDRETDIHLDLEHPNIISMYGYFRDGDKIVCVLEYLPGGDVYQELYNGTPNGHFSYGKAATYIHQITLALEYLHSKGIIHRDIKLENLLIGPFGEIKMADFGLSIKTGAKDRSRKTYCGTLDYQTPEQVQEKPYTEKIDIWGVGVLLYEFLVGESPFVSTVSERKTHKNITSGKFENPRKFRKLPALAKDLIKKILNTDPKKRPTFSEIRSHPFISKNKSDEKFKLLPGIAEYFCQINTPSYSAKFKNFDFVQDI